MKQRKLLLRLLCVCFIAILIVTGTLPIFAFNTEQFPSTAGAESVYLCHVESDTVLISKHATASIAPASTVKMMTGLLALECYSDRLEEEITVTEEMLKDVKGTSMKLKAGMRIAVLDLIYGVICGGYNDAAQCLALLCDESVPVFVERMNRRAAELGMTRTHYTNPTGWDDPDMTTTVYDLVLLSKAAMQNPTYMAISSDASHTFFHDGQKSDFTIHNRNALISHYYAEGYQNRYAKGLIAGMTDAGGYCVASSLEFEGATYLCIVMGAEAINGEIYSFQIANALLTHMYRYYSYYLLVERDTVMCEMPIRLAVTESKSENATVSCVLEQDLYALLPDSADRTQDLQYRTYLHCEEAVAPIEKGTAVGGVDIYFEGEKIASGVLVAGETVEANSILLALEQIKDILSSRALVVAAPVFLVLLVLYFVLIDKPLRSKKSKTVQYRNFY